MSKNQNMTFLQHLEELRWALLRVLMLIVLVMVAGFIYSDDIQKIIMQPIIDLDLKNFQLQDIKITSPFMAKAIIALFSDLIVCFPYIIYEIFSI